MIFMKKNSDLCQIENIIDKHIKTLRERRLSRLDRELTYELLDEAVTSLVIQYLEYRCDSRKNTDSNIEKIIKNVEKKLFGYLDAKDWQDELTWKEQLANMISSCIMYIMVLVYILLYSDETKAPPSPAPITSTFFMSSLFFISVNFNALLKTLQ